MWSIDNMNIGRRMPAIEIPGVLSRLRLSQERPLGRRPEEPTPRKRLNAKFDNCTRIALDDHSAYDLRTTIERLDSVSSILNSVSKIAESGTKSLR